MSDSPFDELAQRYDAWFESPEGAAIFAVEVECVRGLLQGVPRPWLEVGVGTGRFAQALGIDEGLDPSRAVLELADGRGVQTRLGRAEEMPHEQRSFGGLVMVVTICFLDDPRAALRECARVMSDDGALIVGLVPAASAWGRHYAEQGSEGHPFYSQATFYTCRQVADLASAVGLQLDTARSCLFTPPGAPVGTGEPPLEGIFEEAGFVAMRFRKTGTEPYLHRKPITIGLGDVQEV